eukprot:CAMPEP_0119003568 /NCGR_PEP_ID=MMETSP1176-20130426/641_1 /TAXON_ID=265551 /ORGANISM="Synedropsis recta cf, Strain CCMP1620" /LENGTH=140 /DNA_ID=CAMNT_0006955181 /DNA_START=19 /DNA_END=441 /DNA_ORIENTATION=-
MESYYRRSTRTFTYQKDCILSPIISSITFGGIFAGIDAVQGVPLAQAFSPRMLGRYMGGIYVYNVVQCPMEAIHGRQSLLHNVMAAGMLGYVGVSRGVLGVPFVDPTFTYRYPQVSAPMLAFMIYGGIAGALSAFGGKPL